MTKYLALALVLAGCSSMDSQTPARDAGTDAVTDATTPDTPSGPCTGNCAITAVTATFESTATLDVAFYGVTSADSSLYIEVNRGGDGSCPEESSPTPMYSFVMGNVTFPASDAPYSTGGALLDYTASGDLLGGAPVASAQSIMLTRVAAIDPLTPTGKLAFDITATFASGTATGHFFATHCASMDQ